MPELRLWDERRPSTNLVLAPARLKWGLTITQIDAPESTLIPNAVPLGVEHLPIEHSDLLR